MLEDESRSQIAYVCFCMKKWRSIDHLQSHCQKVHKEFSNHFNCYLRSNLEYYILKKIKENQTPAPDKKDLNQLSDLQKNGKLKRGPKLRSQSFNEKENVLKNSIESYAKRQPKSVESIEQEQLFDQDINDEEKSKKVKQSSTCNKTAHRGRPKILKNIELETLLSYFNDEVAILTYGQPRIMFDFSCNKRAHTALPGMVMKYIKSWRLDSPSKLFPIFKQTRNRLIILNTLTLCQPHFADVFKLQPPFQSYYTQLFNYFLLTFIPFVLRDSDISEWIIKYKAEILLQSQEIKAEIRTFLLWCRRNGDICGDVFLNPRLDFSNNCIQTQKIDKQIAQL